MNMDFRLVQEQSMKLVMTQQLRQAITMLQYSGQELHEYLYEQQLENPLLEVQEAPAYSMRRGSSDVGPLDFTAAAGETLYDSLLSQLRIMHTDPAVYEAAVRFIHCLDESGRCSLSLEEAASETETDPRLLEQAAAVVQQMEPAGVGAFSISECLLLQLQRREEVDPLAERLLDTYTEMLAARQFEEIAEEEGVEREDILASLELIQTLDPSPGESADPVLPHYVTPDVRAEKAGGSWKVYLCRDAIPQLRVNENYARLLQQEDSEVQQYLKKKQEQFAWIQRSIAQRQDTILRVAEAVVRHQEQMLEHGMGSARRLTLKMVAEELDMHESTVSRAAGNKYVETPGGVFELKTFFQSGVAAGNSDAAAAQIKFLMQRIFDEEEKTAPLSDQKVAEKLAYDHDIQISRRTAAKYREEIHVLSSSKRKERK
ncbi:RNA polymerase factor sigma-54 [Alkalicoccus chagannorensis]|uniref:RNA polymerase factor sigma-54 n=1 Tax=Alkalicoccus chagannorensis TaxID=427072 RepID=UPI00041AA2EE|nr:RNA polymerase factor sigma-54 [Alkalicoccus chagannorensis]